MYEFKISNCYRYHRAEKALHFLREIGQVHEYIRGKGLTCRPVKVAIIDTGVLLDARVRNLYGSRLKECRSWLRSNDPKGTLHQEGTDQDGHGTHCTSTMLKCTPEDCEVYVGQAFAAHAESSPVSPCSADTSLRVAQVCRATSLQEGRIATIDPIRLSNTLSTIGRWTSYQCLSASNPKMLSLTPP